MNNEHGSMRSGTENMPHNGVSMNVYNKCSEQQHKHSAELTQGDDEIVQFPGQPNIAPITPRCERRGALRGGGLGGGAVPPEIAGGTGHVGKGAATDGESSSSEEVAGEEAVVTGPAVVGTA